MKTSPAARSVSALAALALLATPGTAPGQAESESAREWITDFEEAKSVAASEKKDILLKFVGSDWCTWCQRLEQEVFETERFRDSDIAAQFVLAEIDLPQNASLLSEEDMKANKALQELFKVKKFPAVFTLDSEGVPYARSGYRDGGAERYLADLRRFEQIGEKRDAAFAKAEQSEGLERAKHLANALNAVDSTLLDPHYQNVVDEIRRLDPNDSLGLQQTLTASASEGPRRTELTRAYFEELDRLSADGNWEGAAAAVDRYAANAGLRGEQLQKALIMKLRMLEKQGRYDDAIAELDRIVAIDPDSRTAESLDTAQRARLERVKDR